MVQFDIFEKHSSKKKIFDILLQKRKLTAKEMHNILKKQFTINNTYQSTFKLLNAMVENKILEKDTLRYKINIDWLTKQRDFLNSIISSVHESSCCIFSSEFIRVFRFYSLKDVDTFIQEGILKLAKKNNFETTYWKTPHCWWLLSNPVEEDSVVEEYSNIQLKSSALITSNTRLDIVAKKYYELKRDAYTSITIKEIKNSEVVQVIGDYVFICDIPKDILEELDCIYALKKTSNILPTILELVIRKTPFEVKIIKDKKIAQAYVNEIQNH